MIPAVSIPQPSAAPPGSSNFPFSLPDPAAVMAAIAAKKAAASAPALPTQLANGVTLQWNVPQTDSSGAPAQPAMQAVQSASSGQPMPPAAAMPTQLSDGTTLQWADPNQATVSAPGDSPVSQAMGTQGAFDSTGLPYDDPTKLPKFGTTAIASLPRDPTTKAKYLATKLFPDLPPNDALKRMGFDGNRYYYIADDGKAYYAEPTFQPMSAPGLTLKELPDTLLSQVGPAMPAAGGMGAAIAAGPDPASIPAAAAGGAAGEAARQFLANKLTGETQDWEPRAMDIAGQGGEQALNQALGLGLGGVASKVVDRNPLRVAGYDVSSLTPTKIADMQTATDKAAAIGVNVTPGEAGNVSSLLDNQRQLSRYPESTNQMTDFYADRNTNQIPSAFQTMLDKISPVTASSVANRDLGTAAGATIQASRDARSALAAPLYQKAYAANPNIATPAIDRILQTPAGQQAMKNAAVTMQNRMSLMGASDPELTAAKNEAVKLGLMTDPSTGAGVASGLKLQTYDLIKQKLYELEQAAKNPQTNAATTDSSAISDLRQGLTNELDKADVTATPAPPTEADLLARYPGTINAGRRAAILASSPPAAPGLYAQARKVFQTESPDVTDLEKGIVGMVAKPKANALQSLPKVLFSATSSDPYSIAQAKSAFQKAGQMDQWNAGVRSFLQNTFDDASKAAGRAGDGNVAPGLWKNIAGDNRQMANLKAALGPTQFGALNDFMDVARMVARARPVGSQTATDMMARSRLASPLASTAAKAIRGIDVFNIPNDIAAKVVDVSAGKNAAALADLIQNPGAVASLKRLKVLSPTSKQFIQELGNFGAAVGWTQGGKAVGYDQQPGQPVGSIGTDGSQ